MHPLDTLSMKSEPLGLKVSRIQVFVALFDRNIVVPQPVTVQGEYVSFVDSFVYLWNAIGNGNSVLRDELP